MLGPGEKGHTIAGQKGPISADLKGPISISIDGELRGSAPRLPLDYHDFP